MEQSYPTFQFEKLELWTEARKLNKLVYLSTQTFPKSEQFGLTNQIRRASVSTISNFIEGNYRKSPKDKAHFTTISYSSLMEMMGQIILSEDLNFISEPEVIKIREQTFLVSKLLSGLRRSQIKD